MRAQFAGAAGAVVCRCKSAAARPALRTASSLMGAVAVIAWAGSATSLAASPPPQLLRQDVSSNFAAQPATIRLGCCGKFVISGPHVSSRGFRAGRVGRIRWASWGSAQAVGAGLLWIDTGYPSCGSAAFRPTRVSIWASGVKNGRYTQLLLVYWYRNHRLHDQRALRQVPRLKGPLYEWFGPGTHGGRAPGVSTLTAGSITQTAATISGTVSPNRRSTAYYFQYGTTTSYGASTPLRAAGSGPHRINVSAALGALSSGTTYHYRIDARSAPGTACGSDKTFTTAMTTQELAASRAVATFNAIQHYFYAANVYPGDTTSLYSENYPQSGQRYSFLWPFSRVLAGTITLAGVPSYLVGGASYGPAVADRLSGLSRYWDGRSNPPGYDSYPPAPYGQGGDKYYDDQAWVGLAAAQNYAMTGDPTSLADAKNVFNFVYPGGWASGAGFDPGGIYWVSQGTGVGAKNHDRTTTSNAPNAEIALLLEGFDPVNAAAYDAGATQMYQWANHYLYNVKSNPTDPIGPNPNLSPSQPALMFDKVTGANSIDQTLYTYNQGTMIAVNVREYQKTGNAAYLADAEAIANAALANFNETYYISHSAAFNAIFFRGLLVLSSVTSDSGLQARIIQTIQTYADDAWNNYRAPNGLFSFPSTYGAGFQLLDQGALLQIYAMLAWSPTDYGKLP